MRSASAQAGRPAFLYLDEVQNLADWDIPLKSLVDHATARVLVTGSSALPIERGRDPLGLRAFLEKSANHAVFRLLIVRQDGDQVDNPRFISLPLPHLLIVR